MSENEPNPNPSLKGREAEILGKVLSMGAVGSATMTMTGPSPAVMMIRPTAL